MRRGAVVAHVLLLGGLLAVFPILAHATARATLGWTDSTGEDGYRVERRSGGAANPFNQIGADLPAGTISFTETGLAEGVEHCYRVRAFNSFDALGVVTPVLCQTGGSPSTPGGFFFNLMKE